MDEKLNAVLSNTELMEKIANLIKGEAPPPPPPPVVEERPVSSFVPTAGFAENKGVALLRALKPFLKESRRKKLDTAVGALSVASLMGGSKQV